MLALIAPRLLYVASAEDDAWAGPVGEWRGIVSAGRAWAKAGFPHFEDHDPPAVGEPRRIGRLGYHLRRGPHDLIGYDWDRWMDLIDAAGLPLAD